MLANIFYLIGSASFAVGTLIPPLATPVYLTGSGAFAAGTITNMVGARR
jgi:hypothetical protein